MIREECTPSSSWWEDVQHHHHNDHASSISTSFFHKNSNGNNNNNSNANASCEGDNLSISTVNASNRFDLTAESSNRHSLSAPDQPASTSDELLRDHVVISSNNHLWSLAYLPGRSLGDQMMGHHHHHHNHNQISSRNNSSTTSELPFEPVCDNANGNGWIYDTNQVRYDPSNEQRLSKLTDLVGKHWSLAPPNNPDMNHSLHHHFDQTNDDVSIYRQALEVKNEEDLCYNNGLSGGASLFHDAIESSRSFLDIRLSRPLTDINPSFKPCFKALNLSEFNKKEHQTPPLANVRLGTTNAGKKKRCDEVSDEVSKKPKCGGGSRLSPDKELPKPKLRDKITTLQQIVSPFGKTDTASVLQEAITYINFYQEQVKLLSTPYMKNSSIKDPWGGWDREEHNKRGPKHLDLKSRGLCLVPISCTPVAYRDNSATDYWSPSYRGSLYR